MRFGERLVAMDQGIVQSIKNPRQWLIAVRALFHGRVSARVGSLVDEPIRGCARWHPAAKTDGWWLLAVGQTVEVILDMVKAYFLDQTSVLALQGGDRTG